MIREGEVIVTFGDFISTTSLVIVVMIYYKSKKELGANVNVFDNGVEARIFKSKEFPDKSSKLIEHNNNHYFGSLRLDSLIFYNIGDRMSIITVKSIELLKDDFVSIEDVRISSSISNISASIIVEPNRQAIPKFSDLGLFKKSNILPIFNQNEKLKIKYSFTFKKSLKTVEKTIPINLKIV